MAGEVRGKRPEKDPRTPAPGGEHCRRYRYRPGCLLSRRPFPHPFPSREWTEGTKPCGQLYKATGIGEGPPSHPWGARDKWNRILFVPWVEGRLECKPINGSCWE